MGHCVRYRVAASALILVSCLAADATAQTGRWRIASGVQAPWVAAAGQTLTNAALRGQILEFATGRVTGPAPLGCSSAVYQFVVTPAEGLFQGSLPKPAEAAARALGVTSLPVMTLSVNCSTGVFDYHFVAANRLLFALDNVIWTLTAAVQPPRGPTAVVQEFLIEHMTHDMVFTAATLRPKQRFFSQDLTARIAAYFARPLPTDEPPPINGDPFTNTQEYPDRFTIGGSETADDTARVRVLFRIGPRNRPVDMLLRRVANQWRIDDLRYEDGATFRALLER
jgi:hypothetical protein